MPIFRVIFRPLAPYGRKGAGLGPVGGLIAAFRQMPIGDTGPHSALLRPLFSHKGLMAGIWGANARETGREGGAVEFNRRGGGGWAWGIGKRGEINKTFIYSEQRG
jgi:hypothetical protein